MKKIIIAAALVLTSAVTAFSLTTKADNKTESTQVNTDSSAISVATPSSAPKADIGTAD
ncbi:MULTISPECIES: hypothetical protein [unclassified Mucilaginibacter]|uniref:hypothetical protein n=1 Tax=unclassified Mucilaginibacter TaxID=2617802 RepID=UPI00138BAB58|nr:MULTISPECIES: hypothetical protein [unclassified Mucilaginibacter]MBB5393998.1 putative low-complexity protein [Mucilaginibacter sp. AK015]QHS57602.1 hypothetical protein GWR56_19385 [Mucilaginibacter sp. 14171R-50]